MGNDAMVCDQVRDRQPLAGWSSFGPIPWLVYEGHEELPVLVVNGPREG